MSKHTPEPWGDSQLRLCFVEFEKLGITVSIPQYADEEAKANSRRILSCVNACAGMADPAAEIAELKQQRDELLAALHDAAKALDELGRFHFSAKYWSSKAYSAIAETKGSAS